MEEIEVKFLDINIEEIENKLKAIGALKVGDYHYRRQIFDYPDFRLDQAASWIRLRDEGDKITLSFKKRLGVTAHDGSASDEGMEEVEVEVSDFDKTSMFFEKIGLIKKFYQENKRTRWKKDDIEFDIDQWPQLEPYLEIETTSWEKIDEAIKLLELNPDDKKIFATNQVYKMKGIDEIDYVTMTFDSFVRRDKK